LNYEWQFGGSAKQAVGTNGFPITNCSVTGPADCIFEKAVLGVTNYVAVRSEFGGMYSKWSNVMACD
jgi:hypothetical protein